MMSWKRSSLYTGLVLIGALSAAATLKSWHHHPVPSPTPSPVHTATAAPTSAPTPSEYPTIVVVPTAKPLVGNYYVAVTGSDLNAGTKDAPFRTLQKAANVATSGQVVIADCGVYYFTSTYGVSLTKSGTVGNPIRFVSANPKCAVLDGSNFTSGYAFSLNTNGEGFISIEGFDIRDFLYAGLWLNMGSNGIADGNHDVVISGNHIHNIGNVTTTTPYGKVGIGASQGTRNVQILNNEIDHIGRLGGNGQDDHGLYIGGGNYTIVGNYFHDNDEGWDAQIDGHSGDLDAGYLVSGNTFGTHANVGGASNPGNIVIWANTGKTPAGSLTGNSFVANGGHPPLHCYPQTAIGAPTWIISGNSIPAGIAITDCKGITIQ